MVAAMGQFFQDLANHTFQSYSLQGLVPASLGFTKSSGAPIGPEVAVIVSRMVTEDAGEGDHSKLAAC
jgi:hypothetical protein